MYPKSAMGYVIGAMCALTGILATGLPVPIIANNFNIYYTHAKLKEELRMRKPQTDDDDNSELPVLCGVDNTKELLAMTEASVWFRASVRRGRGKMCKNGEG